LDHPEPTAVIARVPRAEPTSDGPGGPAVLLTGATGLIGGVLLARYLERTDRRLFVLVRGRNERESAARLTRLMRQLFGPEHPYGGRVQAIRGDVARPGLALRKKRDALAEQVSEITHCAASVSFELGLDGSRANNLEGTRQMLEFAELCQARGGMRRLSHLSTAYVAGSWEGRFSEDDLDVGQRFRNAYEQSKFEAETLIGRWRSRLPVTVLRPSIVVGERDSGWATAFNALYWPLRAFSRGAVAALPARSEALVDVVPADYVADATIALSQMREAEGATFNLTAGAHATSVGEIVELASTYFERPPPRLLDPRLYRHVVHPLLMRASRDERLRRSLARSEIFFPYFNPKVSFDNRRARVALHATDVRLTPLRTYFNRLVQFAVEAEWGRRQLPRAGGSPELAAPAHQVPQLAEAQATPVLVPAL